MDEETKATALRAHNDHWSYFRSLHEARLLDARAAVQTLLLVNGAAATAVLAFLGSTTASRPHHIPRAFIWALGAFGAGVFFGACISVAAYFTNHLNTESVGARQLTWVHPFVEPTKRSLKCERHAHRAHNVAYAFVAAAVAAFLFGLAAAAVGFALL